MKNERLKRHIEYLEILETCKTKAGEYFTQAGKIKSIFEAYKPTQRTRNDGTTYNETPYNTGSENWTTYDNRPAELLFKIYYRETDSRQGYSIQTDSFYHIVKSNPVESLIEQVKKVIDFEGEENKKAENGTFYREGKKDAIELATREIEKRIEDYKKYGINADKYLETAKGMTEILKAINRL